MCKNKRSARRRLAKRARNEEKVRRRRAKHAKNKGSAPPSNSPPWFWGISGRRSQNRYDVYLPCTEEKNDSLFSEMFQVLICSSFFARFARLRRAFPLFLRVPRAKPLVFCASSALPAFRISASKYFFNSHTIAKFVISQV